MVDFATTTDMESRSQGEITVAAYPGLAAELASATRAIRDACGWHIATQEEVLYSRVSRYPRAVFLPASQISALVYVSINGIEVPLSQIEWDSLTGETNIYARAVEVRFVAGYSTVPETLRTLTLDLAAAGLGTATGITREQAGAVALTYARTGKIDPGDAPMLAPYKLGPIA